ncbi:predicted Fe-S oxidoreductase [Hahella chejuensis KCTC 2396]|uniref:Predicted Fe-S oxidoreductase n=1 Tax=Hahella chejuensis (strain KCTC 2396) TaxID=349521 RepID=Q2SCT9_HAHCH|nr:arsenosugar biosynthesis radical SAM (seleno)protein ArsS [Hahella chejuensis]ABC31535.1 predicted Fe-S oxidoreductase [Hahella chejuensis KCTC 2396]
MLDVRPMLMVSNFPAISRGTLETLQVNLGYKCNLSCTHCHVAAGPTRTEMMTEAVIAEVLEFIKVKNIKVLDLTGGAPEMNPHFRSLVAEARALGVSVMDRCNLTILLEEGQEYLADFLAQQGVEIVASLPCYAEQNVDKQRGKGVYQESIAALKKLNALGYGREGSGLTLNLVYNPGGPFLPPGQEKLEADYKRELFERHGVEFNQLFVLTNMPISRFGSVLLSKGQFNDYMQLLHASYSEPNLHSVMCRTLISVDWQGYVYDCDFNQMLDIPLIASDKPKVRLRDLMAENLEGASIATADHCYGCTAGQGSSCGGALD